MTWRDAALALGMQKVVDLSSLTNYPDWLEARFLSFPFSDSLKGATRRSVMVA